MNPDRVKFLSLIHLPARLNPEETGWYLAFPTTEIPRLTKAKFLTPLGNPGRSATKYYAEVDLRRLRNDPNWLHKATAFLLNYWKKIHERRQQRKQQKRKRP